MTLARAMPPHPAGEHVFMKRMLRTLTEEEAAVPRIYSDHLGIPTMGIGKALAVRARVPGARRYRLLAKAAVERLVAQGGGNADYTMPEAESRRVRNAVAHLNAGRSEAAKALIPVDRGKTERLSDNKFRFTLTEAGMAAIARKEIERARRRVLALYRRTAAARGWNAADIRSYEEALRTSGQMAALASLAYNGVSAPRTIAHMLDGEAPAAYLEIAYRSNANRSRGLAKRRVREAKSFIQGNEPREASERQGWAEHAARHAPELAAYEARRPEAFAKGRALASFGETTRQAGEAETGRAV